MLRELTTGGEVEALDLVNSESRKAEGRPWVLVNFVTSIDGATTVKGKSSALGDADDLTMFKAIRSLPDVILVGAGTVRAEDYQPVVLDEERRVFRRERGQSDDPILAIVSGSLGIDPEARVFADPDHKPLILTSTTADPGRLVNIGDMAEIAFLIELTPKKILDQLGAASVVLLEGGPTLTGQFVAAGLVDEMCLTVSPLLVGGDSKRVAVGAEAGPPLGMTLDRAHLGEGSLFLRYLRAEEKEES